MENAEKQDQRIAIPEAQKQQVLTQQHRLMKLPETHTLLLFGRKRSTNLLQTRLLKIPG